MAREKVFRANQVVFKEGESSNCMYLVQKGTVSIRKMKGSGYIEIARIYPNQVIGELSFFDRLPRSATAVTMSEVKALEIDFESLDKIYAGVPEYMRTIMSCVAERLRKANETIRRLQRRVIVESGSKRQVVEDTSEEVAATEAESDSDDLMAAITGSDGETPPADDGSEGAAGT